MYKGTVNINDIQLLSTRYTSQKPSEKKMAKRRMEYAIDQKLYITVREGTKELLDGYTYYILAKELKLGNVECNYVSKNEKFLTPALSISEGFEIKNEIFKKDNYKCYICNENIVVRTDCDDVNLGTVDHVVPRAKGGCSNMKNLRCCCRFCNSMKADLPLTDELKNSIKIEKKFVNVHKIKTVEKYKEYKRLEGKVVC